MEQPGTSPTEQPVAPAPVAPAAEVETPVVEPTAEEVEKNEWDEAAKDLFPDLNVEGKKEEKKTEEPADPNKPADSTKEEKPAEEVEKPVENQPVDVRQTNREIAAEVESVKVDIHEQLFKDVPLELKDADGDLINSVGDVMKLVDPRTGETFTEEAASSWLALARQDLAGRKDQVEKAVDRIAQVNVQIKDEADAVGKQFGELLKAQPELGKKLWNQFAKTLKFQGKVIVEAPVSLREFYSVALAPYAEVSQAQAQAAEASKKTEEVQRRQTHADRSDVFGGGKVDTTSEEDKEWAEAHKQVFN